MLEKIIKLETELALLVATAKKETEIAIGHAHTSASEAKVALEESLRNEEAKAIKSAEDRAHKEAKKLIATAESHKDSTMSNTNISQLAKEIIAPYIS